LVPEPDRVVALSRDVRAGGGVAQAADLSARRPRRSPSAASAALIRPIPAGTGTGATGRAARAGSETAWEMSLPWVK
jgi:hypothetical protein